VSHRASRIEARGWSALPRWRRARLGWILLHVLFGLGVLGMAQVVLTGMFILEIERRDRPPVGDIVSWASLGFAVATGLVAWLLFVYLRRSRAVRWTLLLGVLLIGLAVDLGGQFVAERVLTASAV
jgi:hypothetical protein